jgi:hypothetical protein
MKRFWNFKYSFNDDIFYCFWLHNCFGYFFLNLGNKFPNLLVTLLRASLLHNVHEIDDFISFNETWAILIFLCGIVASKTNYEIGFKLRLIIIK